MLIKNLFSLFGGSHQEGRSDNALPNVIDEKESKVIIPEKFKDDIERLESYCGVELRSGLCIEIELSELLEILPREHRRKDAYDKLVKFLADESAGSCMGSSLSPPLYLSKINFAMGSRGILESTPVFTLRFFIHILPALSFSRCSWVRVLMSM